MSESLNHDDTNSISAATESKSDEAPASSDATSETVESPAVAPTPKKRRGFAVMDPKRVSEIASKGGKAAHAAGTAHEFSREEAREAGRKGGYATHARRKGKGTGEGAPTGG